MIPTPTSPSCGRRTTAVYSGRGADIVMQSSEMALRPAGCRCRLIERLNGHGLVVHDVEDGIQPCNLHQIVDLIREVEQLQFSLLLPHARESTDQMAQA